MKNKTVRVTFNNGKEMLFGNSYKKWTLQYIEWKFMSNNRPLQVLKFETSKEPWVAYGGLKWCSSEYFQRELDDEGKGRKYEDFKFKTTKIKEFMKIL